MKIKIYDFFALNLLLSLSYCSQTDSNVFMLEVKNTSYSSKEIPVHADIHLPSEFQGVPAGDIQVTMQSADGVYKDIPGQIAETYNGNHQLWWILPETNNDRSVKWKAILEKNVNPATAVFQWEDTPGKYMDLMFGDKRVFRYNYELDDHFVEGNHLTANNKVFYHIYDMEGENLITNGPEDGVWSHQRGIMIGWRDVKFKEQKLSFWGMEDRTVIKHIEFTKKTSGPVLAKLETLIHWNDSTGTTIIEEKRTATIYNQSAPAILLLDFTSALKNTINAPVILDGNADHGGVQYRAHNDVAEGAPGSQLSTYYFHQDGIDPLEDQNLPWVGMTYGLQNKMYSVLDMDHPANPKPNVWSAYRDYGRFGPFFSHELDANESLNVNYRFWISESSMPEKNTLGAKYDAYQNPPQLEVIPK
jgi:hypothetical protein